MTEHNPFALKFVICDVVTINIIKFKWRRPREILQGNFVNCVTSFCRQNEFFGHTASAGKRRTMSTSRRVSPRATRNPSISARALPIEAMRCVNSGASALFKIISTYKDGGISGASLILRPGIQTLLQDAQRQQFDVVLAEALDRISRDQADVATLFKHLRFAGVPIITLAEGEISELHVGLKGTMNALFLKDLAAKTHRGLRGRVEDGKSGGGRGHVKRGTGLINNELYIGRLVWNRQRYVKDPSTGRRVSRMNAESEWIVAEVPELRIIDDELCVSGEGHRPELAKIHRTLKQMLSAIEEGGHSRGMTERMRELEAREDRNEAAEAIRALVEKITPRPGPNRGEIDATLHGELGKILGWIEAQAVEKTRKRETPAAFATGVSVSVVAGTGFEPVTFRL